MIIQGRIKYPPNWKIKSKFVHFRDGYKCTKCGLGKDDFYVKPEKKNKQLEFGRREPLFVFDCEIENGVYVVQKKVEFAPKKVKLDASHKWHEMQFSMLDQIELLCSADHARKDSNRRRVSWYYKHQKEMLFNV